MSTQIIEPLRNGEFAPAEVQLLTPLKEKEEQKRRERLELERQRSAESLGSVNLGGELQRATVDVELPQENRQTEILENLSSSHSMSPEKLSEN